MNRENERHPSKRSRAGASLLAFVAMACSLRGLDDLQQNESPGVGGGGDTTSGTGGGSNSGGTHPAASVISASNGGSTTASSTAMFPNGGASSTTYGGASNVESNTWTSAGATGASSATGGVSSSKVTGVGGTTSAALGTAGNANAGGATGGVNSAGATGGANSSGATGGVNSGGAPSVGGTTNADSSLGGAPSLGGTLSTGGVASIGGTFGTGGTSSSAPTDGAGTGGTPGMTYEVLGQSCSAGLTCLTGVSCCAQIEVPSGSFQMGTNTDSSRSADESPPHSATVDSFQMDEFEVTVGRFRSFYQVYDGTFPGTGAGANPKRSGTGWQVDYNSNMPFSKAALQTAINCNLGQYQNWTEIAGVRENMPMNCVSWYVAFAFCIWDGGRLPSEAEWEKAASSGSKEWRFPWGSTDPDPATSAVMNCLGDGVSGCTPSDILPVGSRLQGANTWGHLDLAGSLWEWAFDYYDATYYQALGACDNCTNIAGTTPRVIRGGAFLSTAAAVRATGRASKIPITFDPYTGFRCVRSQ